MSSHCSTKDEKRLELLVSEIATKQNWAKIIPDSTSFEMDITVKDFSIAIRNLEGKKETIKGDNDRLGNKLLKKACIKNGKGYTPNPNTPQGLVLLKLLGIPTFESTDNNNQLNSLKRTGEDLEELPSKRVQYGNPTYPTFFRGEEVLDESNTIEPTVEPTITATKTREDIPPGALITLENVLYDAFAPIKIGRDNSSTIRLTDERVSNEHALIQFKNDRFTITRLVNTKTGVQVNCFQLKPGEELDLCKDDVIVIGPSHLLTVNTISHTVPRRNYTVEVRNENGQPLYSFPCYFTTFDIGRGCNCNISVNDEEVSRVHVEVSRSESSINFRLVGKNSISINGSFCSENNPRVTISDFSQPITLMLSRKSLLTLK